MIVGQKLSRGCPDIQHWRCVIRIAKSLAEVSTLVSYKNLAIFGIKETLWFWYQLIELERVLKMYVCGLKANPH